MTEPKLYAKVKTSVAAMQFTGGPENAELILRWILDTTDRTEEGKWHPATFDIVGVDKIRYEVAESLETSSVHAGVTDWIVFGDAEGRPRFSVVPDNVFRNKFVADEEDNQNETHTEETMSRVFQALQESDTVHLTTPQANAVVNELQNAGILFRERA